MTTITQLMETLNTTIDEANIDIEKLEQCNECLATRIEDNQHLISWNNGCIDHAEFTLEEIVKGQKTAIRKVTPAHDEDTRIRLASALHDMTCHWMEVATKRPNIDRVFLDKPFDELAPIDRLAPLRDADTIIDLLRGEPSAEFRQKEAI